MEKRSEDFYWIMCLRPLLVLVVIWTVYWLDWNYFLSLYEYGILPRAFSGLKGVFFAPFIHNSLTHITNNSISLVILMLLMGCFYAQRFYSVLLLGAVLAGVLTWIIGRDSYHCGASGVVYVLISYILFSGLKAKYYRLVAVSLIVVIWYGSSVWYMFPVEDTSISWEGHLSGFVSGAILSLFLPERSLRVQEPKYDWQRPEYDASADPFMQCFDQDGNFIIIPKPNYDDPYRKTLPCVVVLDRYDFSVRK